MNKTTSWRGIPVSATAGAEREHLGDWVGQIQIDDDEFSVRPDGRGGALLNASGCLQISHYDDGTRAFHADPDGTVHGVAGRVGQIVDGKYIDRTDWLEADLGLHAGALEGRDCETAYRAALAGKAVR